MNLRALPPQVVHNVQTGEGQSILRWRLGRRVRPQDREEDRSGGQTCVNQRDGSIGIRSGQSAGIHERLLKVNYL